MTPVQSKYDHILIIGFGGPTCKKDMMPFLRIVAQGRNIPEARLKTVAHHYERIGGVSPYNDHTFRLVEGIRQALWDLGISIPIYVGMRNWNPFLKDTMLEIKKAGHQRGVGVILSAFRSEASCKRYKENVRDAQKDAGAEYIEYDYLPPWHDRPDFIQAQADEVLKVMKPLSQEDRKDLRVLFTAHSIPLSMRERCRECSYEQEFQKASSLIAKRLKLAHWNLGYQSRSGNPSDPWLEPELSKVLRDVKKEGVHSVLLVPVGFFCDNAEVLYDLDIEAQSIAKELGVNYYRAATVCHHPRFASMFAKLCREQLQGMIKRTQEASL